MKNIPKVLIIQPALPKYRISLFNELNKLLPDSSLLILAPSNDENGVHSITDGAEFNFTITSQSKHKLGFSWQPKAISFIRELKKGDILVTSGNPRYIFNILFSLTAKLRGVKIIWWGQARSAKTTKLSLSTKIKFMHIFDLVLLYTEKEARLLSRLTKLKSIHYLNNGINNKEILTLRTPYDARERDNRILFLGRLTEKSDFPLLLEALSRTTNVALDVIGGEPDSEILTTIKNLDLSEKIKFHGMITDEKTIAQIANNCKFFIYPGAVGLSLIHAFNYGLPALIHDNKKNHMPEASSFRELINGISFKQHSARSLAEKIDTMVSSDILLNQLSLNAIKVSKSNYNTESMAKNFYAAITSLKH